MNISQKDFVLTVKKTPVSVKKILKGYIVTKITAHTIHCSKKIYNYIHKYERYCVKYTKLKLINPLALTITVGTPIIVGYLGRKVSSTVSHALLGVANKSNE